jgi:Ca2+-binding RTX toxin-like protein
MVVADGFIEATSPTVFQAYSTVHADPDQINSRGGYTVAGDPPFSPPDTAEDDDGTIAGGRHLHDGDINPDIIELDFSGFALDAPAGLREQVTMGDTIGTITGIVDFDFTDRKLFVTEWDSSQFVNTLPERETTELGADTRSLTVATFNVENLDPTDGQAKFDAIADAMATNLNAPDILMIEEIQDNNGTGTGTNDASQTWQMLVDALNARVPGAKYQWVDQPPVINSEGGQGNGNIRVGFLYDTNRVQLGNLAADAPIEERRKWTDRIGDGTRDAGDLIAFSDDMVAAEINPGDWSSTRKSLLAQFSFNGNTVFLAANHFTAKPGSGDFWQLDQDIAAGQPENAGWERRVQQAEDVWHVMNLIQTSQPSAGVIAGGDFNDFYFYRPLEVLTGFVETDGSARTGGTRLSNLTLSLAEAERYTYTFDGRSQAIDHVVTSAALAAAATYDIVHLNTGYNALAPAGPDADPSISDHDPGVASIDFRSFGERLTGTAGSDNLQGFGGDDRLQGGEGADTIDGGEGSDTADYTEVAPNGVIVNLSTTLISVADRPGATRAVAPNEALDGFDNYETLVSIENAITGDKNDQVYGSDGANRFETRGGNDFLFGGAGADILIGGTGDDTYGVDDAGDQVTENADEGTDTVGTSLAIYTLGANLENLFSSGFLLTARDYRANALNNQVTGALANDVFRMQDGGDDTVRGESGRDAFYFGGAFTSADTVEGGEGNDILILQGDYSAGTVLGGPGQVVSVESLSLFSGSITTYGDTSGASYSYNITSRDENVATGVQMRVNGFGLLSGENLTFDGRAETDGSFLVLGGRGIDTLYGGAGRDVFVFGHDGRFGIGDSVDGGDAFDVVYLRGDYSLDFTSIGGGAGTFANVESIGLLSFTDTSYAGGGDGEFDYNITWDDAMLAAGDLITINGSRLAAGETMTFDGTDESDGAFRIFGGTDADVLRGGAGADLIYGGLGADTMQGGAGNDVFRYQSAEESTAAGGRDGIQDFTLGDIVDLTRIDTDTQTAGDQAFTFIGEAAFSGQKGELRFENQAGNIWKVQGDVDGNGVADLEFFLVVADADPITASDFML